MPLPFRDPNRPTEERVTDLLGRMTLDEKLNMLAGINGFFIRGIERLDVPEIKMGDGPVGVRNWGRSTLYPATQLLAATWDEDLARRFGVSLGRDSRARGMHISLAPGLNIYRHPLSGRNYEYMGEDPLLAGRMGTAAVVGVQSQGVAATVKHFAANNAETRRNFISNDVDERTLREIYLPAFEMAITQGGAWSVMSAYNLLNGIYCTDNSWLNHKLLKEEWGFQGVLMSDWNATRNTMGAVIGGLDLEMPAPAYFKPEILKDLLERRKISPEIIDEKIRRILRLVIANDWLDKQQEDKSIPLNDPQSAALALEVARQGITLLKNEAILPLDRNKIKSVALLGPNATQVVTGLGSGLVRPFDSVTVKAGLQALAPDVRIIEVPWSEPLEYLENSPYVGKLQLEIFKGGTEKKDAPLSTSETDLIAVEWDANHPSLGIGENDRLFARWTGEITAPNSGLGQFVIQAKTINVRVWIDGALRWDSTREGTGSFVFDLEGDRKHALKVEAETHRSNVNLSFKAGWGPVQSLIPEDLAEKVREADATLVFVGFNVIAGEGETFDRPYELPGRQEELIRQTAALNPRTIVALNAGGAVATENWISKIPVFLNAYYTGQSGGTALAEILFGDVNPSGRLPFSYERKWEDCAAFANHAKDWKDTSVRNIVYKEGIFVGYRWFDKRQIAPLFPFGHGLSYTTFDFQNLKTANVRDRVEVTLEVKNTGNRAGAEVVQLYVGQPGCSVERPVRELKDFARVELLPGETKSVRFLLPKRAFSFFHPIEKRWTVEPGNFVIEAGASSRDIRQTASLDYGR